MFHNLVREIQTIRVFNQSEAGFATRIIPSDGNIFLEISGNAGSSIVSLYRDGFEEEVHGVDKSFLSARGTVRH
jgi:hypothetical protein